MTGRPWTREDENILRNLGPSGIGSRGIAEMLGRTRSAVIVRASKCGVKIRDPRGKQYMHTHRTTKEKTANPGIIDDSALAKVRPETVKVKQRPLARGVDWAV
jgi:hypothetical protein